MNRSARESCVVSLQGLTGPIGPHGPAGPNGEKVLRLSVYYEFVNVFNV